MDNNNDNLNFFEKIKENEIKLEEEDYNCTKENIEKLKTLSE